MLGASRRCECCLLLFRFSLLFIVHIEILFRTVNYLDEALNSTSLEILKSFASVASLTLNASPEGCAIFLYEDETDRTQNLPAAKFTTSLQELTINTYYIGPFPVCLFKRLRTVVVAC